LFSHKSILIYKISSTKSNKQGVYIINHSVNIILFIFKNIILKHNVHRNISFIIKGTPTLPFHISFAVNKTPKLLKAGKLCAVGWGFKGSEIPVDEDKIGLPSCNINSTNTTPVTNFIRSLDVDELVTFFLYYSGAWILETWTLETISDLEAALILKEVLIRLVIG
jgi:hypothetical protein